MRIKNNCTNEMRTSGNGLAVFENRTVRNVDSVCTDSDRNIVYFHAPLYENGAGHRSVVHLV